MCAEPRVTTHGYRPLLQRRTGTTGSSRPVVTLLHLSVLLFVAGGCVSLGPAAIRWERTDYNVAIQETQNEQLLLNLVRLRYSDTPIFLELSSISSQLATGAGASAGAELTRLSKQPPSNLWIFGVNAQFSAQPTVTYVPLQGEKFAQQLLSPLRLEAVMLLYRSGWPLKRVLRLCVQRLNQVENAVRASGPTPERGPRYEDFARVLDLIGELNQQGYLDIVYQTPPEAGQPPRIVLQMAPGADRSPEAQELWRLLGLVPGRTHYPVNYPLVERGAAAPLDHLEIETRSLLGVLFYLAQAVEPPEADVGAGRVTVTRTEAGVPFDWIKATGALLRVRSTSLPPTGAVVSVSHRGNWFFIEDEDLSSKATFSLLSHLLALQSGEVQRLVPLLTLPVGRCGR